MAEFFISFWFLQLTGLEPWTLRLWVNRCSMKPYWLGNEIGTRELNQLVISWGPCIMLIGTPIHYHRELKFSGLNEYIFQLMVGLDPRKHGKLTRRRRSNAIDIVVTTLWLRSSSSSDFKHKCKKSKFTWLHIWIQNIFVLLNSSSIRGVMMENI